MNHYYGLPVGYEAPPAGGFGAVHAAAGTFGPMQLGQVQVAAAPAARNALVDGLLPPLLGLFAPPLFCAVTVLTEQFWATPFTLPVLLGCIGWFLFSSFRALGELRRAAMHSDFPGWPALIPIYNLLYWSVQVPAEVRRARRQRGLSPTNRSVALYLLFPVLALRLDLNDLAP
jgi:hypothetical protein